MLSQVGADSVVAGRYTLERRINTAGIGSLWLACDEQTGRTCALRLADGTGHNIFELAARYRAEVDIIDRIRCENVLDILDYGDWNEMPYLVVEHLEGEDLAARLRREGHLPPEPAYRLLAQTARALARAHAVGIVHGDMNPEHILIAEEGTQSVAKVYNFSLTQRASEVSVGTVTKIGTFLRLPYYQSPEQAAGKAFDWRSDLWSLGVLGYECLTGKKPFESAVFGDLVAQILCDPIPELKLPGAQTPAALQAWWEKACTRDPDKRFQSAKQMSNALGQAFDFPIVFVPEGAFGTSAIATPPVPGVTEESRVGIRTKSKSKIARLATQIGLGGGKSKVPRPAPVTKEPHVEVPAPARESIDVEVPVSSGRSVDIEVPAPARESIDVEVPVPARQSVDVEVPAPESVELPDDLFADFQATEGPTLSLRQVAAAPDADGPDPDQIAIQLKRTKSLRKIVTLTLAILVAIILLPVTRMALSRRHAMAPPKPASAVSVVAVAQASDIAPMGSNAPAVSAAQAVPEPAASTEGAPSAEAVSSGSASVAPEIASVPPEYPKGAASRATSAPRTHTAKSLVASGNASTTPPLPSKHEKSTSESQPVVTPKPAKPKAQAATRDYGI